MLKMYQMENLLPLSSATDAEINEVANAALFSGDLSRALIFSSLVLGTNQTDWAVVRFASCVEKVVGPDEALFILNRYNTQFRETNYRLAQIHFALLSGRDEDACVASKRVLVDPITGPLNLEYLLSLVKSFVSRGADSDLMLVATKFGAQLLSEIWCLNSFVSLVKSLKSFDEVLLIVLELAWQNWVSLGDQVRKRIAFFFIVLGLNRWPTLENSDPEWSSLEEFRRFYKANELSSAIQDYEGIQASGRFLSGQQLADEIRDALTVAKGYSFVRIGDGEGRFLRDISQYPSMHEESLRIAERVWFWNSVSGPNQSFLRQLREAYLGADVLGISPPARLRFEARNSYLGYLGVVSGNQFALRSAQDGSRFFTDNWNNEVLDRDRVFEQLVSAAQSEGRGVVVISPYRDFKKSISFLDLACVHPIVVPSEGNKYLMAHSISVPHYPDCFELVISQIRERHGDLFLIASGVFAKIYCLVAKQSGNVAIDVGAIFDKWMNVPTR